MYLVLNKNIFFQLLKNFIVAFCTFIFIIYQELNEQKCIWNVFIMFLNLLNIHLLKDFNHFQEVLFFRLQI